jgi:hypothetical protein
VTPRQSAARRQQSAPGVIDLLELVKINKQDSQMLLVLIGLMHAFFQTLNEAPAIGKASQRIVVSEVIELAFSLPALYYLAFKQAIGTFKFLRARFNLYFKVIPRRLDLSLLLAEDSISPADQQKLHQIESGQHRDQACRHPPQGTTQCGRVRRHILIKFKNALYRFALAVRIGT